MKYSIGYEKNSIAQSIIIDGPDADTCIAYFQECKPDATVYGASIADSVKPGQPVRTVPDGWKPAQEAQEAQEAQQTGETLYLEKRGCDFFSGDPVAQLSDIGNYRVVTHGETVPGKDGRMYCFEFTHWERYNYRTTHKVTGKPLKHHVKELMNPNALCIDSQYTDGNGCWRNCTLESELDSRNRDFTVAGILETVNEVSSTHYSRIVFAPEKAIKAVSRIRKQAGFRELSILDNLESVEVKQADRQYLVFAYYDMDGNGFEYEYNSDRIVG